MTFEKAHFIGATLADVVTDPATGLQSSPVKYSAREMRLPLDAIAYREGVSGIYDLQVVQNPAGANQSVTILPGRGIVAGDVGTGAGKYAIRNNAPIVFTDIPALPSSGSRNHILAAQVHDKKDAGAADYDTVPILIQGGSDGQPPNLSGAKNILPLAMIHRAAGQAGGSSVLTAHITGLRELTGAIPQATGHFEFYGGNGQHIDRNETTRYEPSGLVRPPIGCIVPDETVALVTNLLPGHWRFEFGCKVNGVTVGPRCAYILLSAPGTGGKVRAAATAAVGDASGTPLLVTREFVIQGPGWSVEALIWQNVQTFTNINDSGYFAHFNGVHGPHVPGIALA